MPKKTEYLRGTEDTDDYNLAYVGCLGNFWGGVLKLLLPYFPRKTRIRVCQFEVPCMFVTRKLNTVLGCYMTELDIYTK